MRIAQTMFNESWLEDIQNNGSAANSDENASDFATNDDRTAYDIRNTTVHCATLFFVCSKTKKSLHLFI